MIYFVSDLHGDINFKGFNEYLEKAGDDDLLIILGDMELEFKDTDENKHFTQKFLSAKKRIAFLDGNHENYGYINSFPEDEWMGGKVHRLSDNIVHLKRGNTYTIDGKTFFVFGGCKSTSKWKEMGLWFPGEEPEDKEIALAYENLKKHNYKFDYILTHKYEPYPGYEPICYPLRELTRFIDKNVEFTRWFAGHCHWMGKFDDKHIIIYDELTKIF